MKILRIIARLNVGGPARHVVWLTQGLQDDEFRSALIAGTVPPGEEDMAYFAAEHGVEPVFIEEMSRELSPKDIVSLFKVYRLIRAERPDIIHTHTAKAGTVGRTAAFMYRWLTPGTLIGRPRRVKIVHTFHGHVFHSYYGKLKTGAFLTIERLLGRFATDRIIVITDQQFEEIHGRFRVGRPGRFSVVPLGIELGGTGDDREQTARLRDEMGAGPDDILVGYVGRLTEIKNLSLLLNTAKAYRESGDAGPAIRFVIIGDGHLREELGSEAKRLGVDDIVRFLGNRTDVARLYPALDIVALTSLNEGTPLSLIEAMAAARPVISTGVGGVRDLLGEALESADGFTVCERGIRVDGFSPADYCRGLIYLAKNEKLRERSGAAGREFAVSRYSKERLINDIKELYRALVRD